MGGLDADVTCALDRAVGGTLEAFAAAKVPQPDALIVSSTGARGLADRLGLGDPVDPAFAEAAPERFRSTPLFAGTVDGVTVWAVEHDGEPADSGSPWARAFPVWLAARAGARALLHSSAGTRLDGAPSADAARPVIARVVDHINLSGRTPLTGLGPSRLGPLFPDQTRVHDPGLGSAFDEAAGELGIRGIEAVAACTLGPALATPAELRWCRVAGADVAVQGLADPLIAASHAGLLALALCALTDHAGERASVETLVERSEVAAADLDAAVAAVARRLAPWLAALREQDGESAG